MILIISFIYNTIYFSHVKPDFLIICFKSILVCQEIVKSPYTVKEIFSEVLLRCWKNVTYSMVSSRDVNVLIFLDFSFHYNSVHQNY